MILPLAFQGQTYPSDAGRRCRVRGTVGTRRLAEAREGVRRCGSTGQPERGGLKIVPDRQVVRRLKNKTYAVHFFSAGCLEALLNKAKTLSRASLGRKHAPYRATLARLCFAVNAPLRSIGVLGGVSAGPVNPVAGSAWMCACRMLTAASFNSLFIAPSPSSTLPSSGLWSLGFRLCL